VWTWCGSNFSEKYTWDTFANTNLDVDFKTQARFDRLFFVSPLNASASTVWQPVDFHLVGKSKVSNIDRFPSDHWGMLVTLENPLLQVARRNQSAILQGVAQAKQSIAKSTSVEAAVAVGSGPNLTRKLTDLGVELESFTQTFDAINISVVGLLGLLCSGIIVSILRFRCEATIMREEALMAA